MLKCLGAHVTFVSRCLEEQFCCCFLSLVLVGAFFRGGGGGIYTYKQVLVTKKNAKDKTFFKYLGDKDAMNRSI